MHRGKNIGGGTIGGETFLPGAYIVFGRRHHRLSDITFEGGP
jgi:hypothetical protein